MSHSARRAPRPPAGGERVYVDEFGRPWHAAHERGAAGGVSFPGVGEPRRAERAAAAAARDRGGVRGAVPGAAPGAERVARLVGLADVSDDALRAESVAPPHARRLT
jgi:hypothetical protein